MYPNSLVILGAGPAAREFFWFYHELYPEAPVVFVDDVTPKTEHVINHVAYPVVKDWNFDALRARYAHLENPFTEFMLGVAEPPAKKVLVEKALAHGLKPAPTLISKYAVVRPDCQIGRGGIIISCTFSTGAVLGDYGTIIISTFGSDVVAKDYVTCYTGCHVASDVVLETGVSLGSSTAVMERIRIAPWVVTGQSASVVKPIDEEGITVVGVPARKLEKKPYAAGEGI